MSFVPTLEILTKRSLEGFAEKIARGLDTGVVAIDRSRAHKLAANPNALPEDALLIVARGLNKECVGYVGLMPLSLCLGDGEERIAFTSTGFTSPRARSSGVSELGMDEAERRYSTVVATGNSPAATVFFRKRGYTERESSDVVEIDSQRSQVSLKALAKTLHPHEGEIREHHWRGLSCAERKEILCILSRREPFSVVRDPELIAWMLDNPWFPPSPKPNCIEKAYWFRNGARSVHYRILEVASHRRNERALAIVAFIKNGRGVTLKVLDYGATHHYREVELAATLFMYYARNSSRIDRYVYPARLGEHRICREISSLSSIIRQPYFVRSSSPRVIQHLNDIRFCTTDGDAAFW